MGLWYGFPGYKEQVTISKIDYMIYLIVWKGTVSLLKLLQYFPHNRQRTHIFVMSNAFLSGNFLDQQGFPLLPGIVVLFENPFPWNGIGWQEPGFIPEPFNGIVFPVYIKGAAPGFNTQLPDLFVQQMGSLGQFVTVLHGHGSCPYPFQSGLNLGLPGLCFGFFKVQEAGIGPLKLYGKAVKDRFFFLS